MKKIESYKDLVVWQKEMDFAEDCFRIVEKFPKNQQFTMSSQIWRAAYSIPSNIAEGLSRGTTREYIRYLWVSHGSLRELETRMMLSRRVNLITQDTLDPILTTCESIGKMLLALIRRLESNLSDT